MYLFWLPLFAVGKSNEEGHRFGQTILKMIKVFAILVGPWLESIFATANETYLIFKNPTAKGTTP